MDLTGKTALIIWCLMVPTALAAVALHAGQAFAQGSSDRQACLQAFAPLREEAESRSRLIKAASERHAPPSEACKLIGDFAKSEIKMIKFLEDNSAECGVSLRLADQLKTGHLNTEAMQKKVCALAQQARTLGPGQQGPTFGPAGPVGDFDKIR